MVCRMQHADADAVYLEYFLGVFVEQLYTELVPIRLVVISIYSLVAIYIPMS